MAQPRDYYEILGVPRDADAASIKTSYRKLAMQFHPDRNPGNQEAEDKFKEAAGAYEILSDPEKRAQYDRFGHQAFQGGRSSPHGFQSTEDIFSHFGDIFGDIFGGGSGGGRQRSQRRNEPRRGSDLRYVTEIELEDVLSGLEKEIEFQTEESCQECVGTGAEKGSQAVTCKTCSGSGQVVSRQGFFAMATTCPTCRGQGSVVEKPCKSCRGSGRKTAKRQIRLNIPAGVDTGTRLRVAGEGEGGALGGPPGDLYVELRVRDHKRFERDGENLYADLEVPYIQLILGGEIEVPTLKEKAKVEIPRAFKMGELLKVPGQGLPALRSGRRGDLFFKVQVQFPHKLAAEEEKHLREIAQIQGLNVKNAGQGSLFGRKK
ncbi:MAG: molecular chaperone DnaJ [Bdellovibrionales bacterium]|nr:molecular chaperone DnaJ [Bdellovibrionales bacterium]